MKWDRIEPLRLLAALTGLLGLSAVNAQASISIVNPSFEAPVLADNGFTIGSSTSNTTTAVPGWTISAPGNSVGTFNPTGDSYAGAGNLTSTPAVIEPNGALPAPAHGFNVLFMGNESTTTQLLSTKVTAGTKYVLSFAVGNRANSPAFPSSYSIQLLSGPNISSLTSLGSISPGAVLAGTFKEFELTVNPLASSSARVGEFLAIRFANTASGSSTQIHFDNLVLSVPEPSMLVGFVGIGLLSLRRQRR